MTEFMRQIAFVFLCALSQIFGSAFANPVDSPEWELDELAELTPHPSISPREVVRIQMEALRKNDESDRGIAVAFRFAAPANQRLTGPVERFAQIMRTGMYRPMLNAQKIRYKKEFQGTLLSAQTVTVTDLIGVEHHYMFILRKQFDSPFQDCWMTESVFQRPNPPPEIKLRSS